MDQTKQPTLIPPAQLFIGPDDKLMIHTQQYLQKKFCSHDACGTCNTCRGIRQQQYHALLWLCPEKQYTRESIADVFHIITLALDTDQHFFFVFEKAELLNAASANSLLKSIEEPPEGYHFIFLTERPQQLLPTIRSRCVQKIIHEQTDLIAHNDLFTFFTTSITDSPLTFMQAVDRANINEHESVQLLDQILEYWITKQNKSHQEKMVPNQQIAQTISIIEKAVLKPPMPGSSKLFWKNLFIQLQR